MNAILRSAGLALVAVISASSAFAAEVRQLPPPRTEGGLPLMQALKERRSTREFSSQSIPDQMLSDLLWAAFGINRPGTGHRTAPSAMNHQEIDLYVGTAEGVFLYDAKANTLRRVADGDVRARTGSLPLSTNAPVALVFVADRARMPKAPGPEGEVYAAFDAGCVSQNVYLFCASAGLATVVHEIGDRAPLAQAMNLRAEQKIVYAQAVGYPKAPGGGRP